jgi:hypothetical protein
MEKQKLGYLGSCLLVVGLFLPIVTIPIIGNVTLMSNGTNLAALALVILGGISALLVAGDRRKDLIWPAGAAVASLTYLFGRLQYNLSHMKSEITDSLKGNPFAGVAQAAMGAVQVQWGWLVLATGAGILVYLAVQARKEADVPLVQCSGLNERALLAASLACLMVAPAPDAWRMLRGTNTSSEGAIDAAATEAASADAAPEASATGANAEQAVYIRDHLKIYGLTAKYFDSLVDGRVPGVDFKIKNNGDRTLNKVTVRIVFHDDQGKAIAEEEYTPVFVTSLGYGHDNTPLRPNYIWKQEQGNFYSAKSVPSEWKTGKVTATVTEIEFGPTE